MGGPVHDADPSTDSSDSADSTTEPEVVTEHASEQPVEVHADEAVINTSPDGGGIDHNEAAPSEGEAPAADDSTSDSAPSE